MTPELLFTIGVVICITAAFGTVLAAIILRLSKRRLDKRLDEEYGKRRR